MISPGRHPATGLIMWSTLLLAVALLGSTLLVPPEAQAETITQVLDSSGNGSVGLDAPWGIAVDDVGNVYVAGFLTDNVLKLTPEGTVRMPCRRSST